MGNNERNLKCTATEKNAKKTEAFLLLGEKVAMNKKALLENAAKRTGLCSKVQTKIEEETWCST